MTTAPIKAGTLLAGRYRIEEPIGSGGHAYVFAARQEGLDRRVAIKLLKSAPGMIGGALPPDKVATMIKRFEQEAKLISQLRDPHTITMYDYGSTKEGLFYMVVEYVEGESLKELCKREGPLEPARVVKIIEQLLYSLQEAHALGVLHRDLKPANIMLYTYMGRADQVKLLDFGIAKMVGENSPDLTAEGSVVGTPRYMAPERIRGEELGPSSDLYSLGLMAYEMLTGERVLGDKRGMMALQAQLTEPSLTLPPDLDIPPTLRKIIDRMNLKDATLRYRVADQVLKALEHWQDPNVDLDELSKPAIDVAQVQAAVAKNKRAREPTRDVHEPTERLPAMRVVMEAQKTDEEKARLAERAELDARRSQRAAAMQAERATDAEPRPSAPSKSSAEPRSSAASKSSAPATRRSDNKLIIVLASLLVLFLILALSVIAYIVFVLE